MVIIILFLLLPPIFLSIIDSLLRLIYIIVPFIFLKSTDSYTNKPQKIFYLIVACNEEKVIGESIKILLQSIPSNENHEVAILCDHCTDKTAEIATSLGVKIFFREDGATGKGPALTWFVNNHQEALIGMDIVVVLDADSKVGKNISENLQQVFKPGVSVVQVFVNSMGIDGYSFTTLASYSELLSQYIDDTARSIMKWSVPLRGTGMAFRPELFRIVCANLITQVDDIELSIILERMKVRVHFDMASTVFDPKTPNVRGLARQRGRWLKGQRKIFSTMRFELLDLLGSGLGAWSLVQALLFKPKTALTIIKFTLLFIILASLSHSGILGYLLSTLVGISIFIDLFYYLYGLRFVQQPNKYLSALLHSPVYLLLWFAGWAYSILPGQGWLRGRDW